MPAVHTDRILPPALLTARALAPASVLVAVGATAWLALRLSAPTASYPGVVVGWLLLVLLTTSGVAVVAATAATSGTRTLVAYATVADAAGLLLLLPWLDGGTFGILALLRAYALFVSWTAVLFAVGSALSRRWPSAALPLLATGASVLLALPVLIAPAVRAAGGAWRSALLQGTADAAPPSVLLAALRPDLAFSWPQQPVMYTLTPLGQDYPLPSAAWWPWPVAGVALALLVWGLDRLLRH